MDLLQRRMRDVVDRLAAAQREQALRKGWRPPALRPHAPAKPEDLGRLEAHWELPLPPSYRAFLELHDGYEGLALGGDLFAVADVLPGGRWDEPVRKWKRLSADYGDGSVLDGYFIANSEQPNVWTFLDPNRPVQKGELTVVWSLGSGSLGFSELSLWFEQLIALCKIEPQPAGSA